MSRLTDDQIEYQRRQNCRPVLAFLQNMWVKHPERTKAAIARDGEEFRLTLMRMFLFMGCKTGRNLTKTFGDELIEQITFEETTREIAGDANTIFPADLIHMRACIEKHQPKIVLAFGQIAHDAVSSMRTAADPWVYVSAHHPASRHPTSWNSLLAAAAKVQNELGH